MACYAACPVQAIEILTDEDGFYFPFIKEDKCIKCGRCTSICPINNENNRCFNKKIQVPEIYACTIGDYETKMSSSSGGMFTVLADYTLKSNGYVCGCILDDNLKAIHIVSNKYDDINFPAFFANHPLCPIRNLQLRIKNAISFDGYIVCSSHAEQF